MKRRKKHIKIPYKRTNEREGIDNVPIGYFERSTEIGDCSDKGYEDMYALIVTSYNGKASVTLYFSVLQEVAGVTLDQEVIEF